ncbi:hypothetical protein [Streptomyces sp. bgisy022]|uniref:hypothetical protein n=1 Tax=Streptomyces sp. bgisy022 TaxID=3413769 RepID=UPI003D72E392
MRASTRRVKRHGGRTTGSRKERGEGEEREFTEEPAGLVLTLGTRMVLVPLLLVGEVVGVVAVFRRHGGLRSDF